MESSHRGKLEVDLQILRVVLAVFDAGSVGGAAKKLGMSQPGVSTALQRARIALSDPLFVRVANGMEPTARTRRISEPIREILERVREDVINTNRFDPDRYDGEVSLVLTDVGEASLLPGVVNHMASVCPQVKVRSVGSTLMGIHRDMADGSLDFALGYFPDLHTLRYERAAVCTNTFTCLVSGDHPLRGSTISVKDFLSYGHIEIELMTHSRALLDDFLEDNGIHRSIRLRARQFMSLPLIVARSDLIATVPTGVIGNFVLGPGLRLVEPEFAMPTYESSLYWHVSMSEDPRNIWLRQMILRHFNHPKVLRASH